MEFGLERFLEAQDKVDFGITYEDAMERLKNGKFLTDGLWYIFPTLKEFGSSKNDKFFGLASLYAAYEFWAIPQLRNRLKEVTLLIARNSKGRTAEEILGEEGAKRLHSCITLFDAVYPDVMFDEANDAYFGGEWDKETAKSFKKDWHDIHNDVWRKFHSKYSEKAYFDYASYEAENGTDGKKMMPWQRYASFLHLSKYGYETYKLSFSYLVTRDWLGNEEREDYTRETLLVTYNDLRKALIEWSEKNKLDRRLLESLFPNMEREIFKKDISWRKATFMFDALCRFAISYPQLNLFVEEAIKKHSLLSNVECPEKLMESEWDILSVLSKGNEDRK